MTSEESMQNAIKSTFEQHHNEIKRRSEITKQGFTDDKTFTKVEDNNNFSFKFDDQAFVVFSLSQESFAPIPVNNSNPAICIYGAFPTREEAVEYAHNVIKEHNISIFVDQTHKWIAAVKNTECMTNNTYIESHTSKLIKKHQEMLHTNLQEFKENVENKKAGNTTKNEKSDQPDQPKETTEKNSKSHKISSKLDVRGQKLAVVSFVKDDADIPEFLCQIFAFFDKEEDANVYIRNVCGDKIQDFDIDVVSTCEWIFPQNMTYENANKEIFRSEELDHIMRNHKNQPKEVARFKDAMDKNEPETNNNSLTNNTANTSSNDAENNTEPSILELE